MRPPSLARPGAIVAIVAALVAGVVAATVAAAAAAAAAVAVAAIVSAAYAATKKRRALARRPLALAMGLQRLQVFCHPLNLANESTNIQIEFHAFPIRKRRT